jgi:uncharacterized NAD(P)/FAD-binding protein YdhS
MRTVAVIGGGLSGSLLGLQLLRSATEPLRVRLIDRDGAFGRGVAYSTGDDLHLLNVPATRMSAYPDSPDHFVDWLEGRYGAVDPADYVPRGVYGSYIREQLARAGAAIELAQAEVVDVEPEPGGQGGRVHCAGGASEVYTHVVLATGSPVGAPPLDLPDDPRVFTNPWADGAPRPYPAGHHTIIVGSGLTAIDVALSTTRLGASVTAVSRHGLLPEQHRPGLHQPVAPAALPHGEMSLAEMERFVTAHIRSVRSSCGDWRDAFDGLRPHVPSLWGTLAPAARREFLQSRVRQWDVCRHRMAPASARRIAALQAAGRLRVVAAPLGAVTAEAEGLHVEFGGRGVRADRLVCCTGASRDVRSDPLVAQLVQRGVAVCDELLLGLRADTSGAVYDAAGSAQPWLHTLGPLRRGELWETTAAEEIRAQAEMLAHAILRTDSVAVS